MASIFAASIAQADTWPSRLIKATIPFGAGSAADVVPRLVFDRLAAELGQPIVIENRVGAGGTVGTGALAKAEPDGYNILAHSSALTVAPALFPNLTYDTTKDLAGALMLGSTANVMIVPNERPWKTVQDFIAEAKAKPGSISFGSVGIGSAVHISSEKFRLAAGIQATHVPYRGGSEVITDILGGRIDFYFCPLATALPLIKEGRVQRAGGLHQQARPRPARRADPGRHRAEGRRQPDLVRRVRAGKNAARDRREASCSGSKVLADPAMQASLKKLGIEPMPLSPKADGRAGRARNGGQSRTDQGCRHQTVRGGLRRRGLRRADGLATKCAAAFSSHVGNPLHEQPFLADPVARPEALQPHHGLADVPVLVRERRGQ